MGQNNQELRRNLQARHLFMISLGGIIGTGLFVSSGQTVYNAGPIGAIIAYIVGGFIMYLTMLCLGELSVAMPVAGSFQTYTTKFIGPGTGFAVGWLYWFGWAMTVALEFFSAAALMERWFPNVPTWIWCMGFAVIMFGLNALSAKAFGEAEFWFSSIKVTAIILFILLGLGAMFGVVNMSGGHAAPGFSNFVAEGWFPHGFGAVFITMLAVNFSFQGTELIGIAAGESKNPEVTIPKSIRQTVWRTLLFFVLAIGIVSALLPLTEAKEVGSPFVEVFDRIGVPYAADIMNFVVLTALLSVANSGLYAATRMLFSLSKEGMASPKLGKLNKRGIPMNALYITLGIALLSLLSAFFKNQTVFNWLLSVAGIGAQVGWIAITASQLAFRRKYVKDGGKVADLKFKTPFYPFLPAVALILNLGVLVSMGFNEEQRLGLYLGVGFFSCCYIYYFLFIHKKKKHQSQRKQNVM
ncbi:Amino acid ABC transporter, permease protein [Fictibacillus macauensis ZFHKF-1]|uniref:Amino acid ABC transporter, permease protein n=1 Tax=Fictibacillus macauensis ZFHKF-1 TaxID=1196324 RepID=I8UD35_9BACL|nr:amino acid permease [Fictibacillus macauensis]EIT84718.1 Amino acid ABC transporter, permease protein [Fictibacillus macauensis ZFHKF-1]